MVESLKGIVPFKSFLSYLTLISVKLNYLRLETVKSHEKLFYEDLKRNC